MQRVGGLPRRTTTRTATLALVAALAVSAGLAWIVPGIATAGLHRSQTIHTHTGHGPQALTPRAPSEDQKDPLHTPQLVAASATDATTVWLTLPHAARFADPGPRRVAVPMANLRAPPLPLD